MTTKATKHDDNKPDLSILTPSAVMVLCTRGPMAAWCDFARWERTGDTDRLVDAIRELDDHLRVRELGSIIDAAYPAAVSGAEEYGRDNWRQGRGLAYTRLISASMRHQIQDLHSEGKKDEVGFLHLGAVAWYWLALLHYELIGGGIDDRFRHEGY